MPIGFLCFREVFGFFGRIALVLDCPGFSAGFCVSFGLAVQWRPLQVTDETRRDGPAVCRLIRAATRGGAWASRAPPRRRVTGVFGTFSGTFSGYFS